MNAQFYALPGGPVETIFGQPLAVRHFGGEFAVLEGRVWLTRRGDIDDHVLAPGDSIVLEPTDEVVIESWRAVEPARVAWRASPRVPAVPRLARAALGATLRGVAGAARTLAAALRHVESGAAALAARAQGCIAGADSAACPGAAR